MSKNEEASRLRELCRCCSVPKCRIYRAEQNGDGSWEVCLRVLPAQIIETFSEEDAQALCRAACPSLFEDSPS